MGGGGGSMVQLRNLGVSAGQEWPRRRSLVLTAAKKQSKKKQQKRKNQHGAQPGGARRGGKEREAEAGEKVGDPPRINTEINISMRKQLRNVRLSKELHARIASSSSSSSSRGGIGDTRSFRRTREYAERKRIDDEQEERELYEPANEMEQWMASQHVSLSPAAIGLYNSNSNRNDENVRKSESILFIDGYNVVGQSPVLRGLRDANKLELARNALLESVCCYCRFKSINCKVSPVVVWDAKSAVGRGAVEEIDYKTKIRMVYTADADAWIEWRVSAMIRDEGYGQFENIWVVTGDILLAQIVFGQGAMVVSSRIFIQELQDTDKIKKVKSFRDEARLTPRHRLMQDVELDHSLGGSPDGDVLKLLKRRIILNEKNKK